MTEQQCTECGHVIEREWECDTCDCQHVGGCVSQYCEGNCDQCENGHSCY